ncbi:hypothetical protein BJX64DRAFT_293266 [Aspergillus heterothallicus]
MVVELDTTLAELHAEYGTSSGLVVDLYRTYTHLDLHENFPREEVLAEDEDPSLYCTKNVSIPRFKQWALNSRTIRHLPLVGPADVILYLPYNSRENIQRALDQFPKHQHPRIKFVDLNSPHIASERKMVIAGKSLVYWRLKSWMVGEDCVVPPDVSYTINDKRFLAHPKIPTPCLEMVSLHRGNNSLAALVKHSLPFVVKFCRCSSGQGTYIVGNESERACMLQAVHRPHCGVNFIVGSRDGPPPRFLGATEHVVTDNGIWVGGIINYEAQRDLKERLQDTIAAVTEALQEVSYVGWVGIDVIFDLNDQPLVVDLNARIAAGIGLALFSNHFLSMGFPFAEMLTVSFCGPAWIIYDMVDAHIKTGKVIVTLSTEVSEVESVASLVFGDKTREGLKAMGGWIRDTVATCRN